MPYLGWKSKVTGTALIGPWAIIQDLSLEIIINAFRFLVLNPFLELIRQFFGKSYVLNAQINQNYYN